MSDESWTSDTAETLESLSELAEIPVSPLSVVADWGEVMARNKGDLDAAINEMRQLRDVFA